MTLEQNFQRMAAVHNRRGKAATFRKRAAIIPPKAPDPAPAKPQPTGTTSKAVATTPPPKATVTPDPKPTVASQKSTSSAALPPSSATTSSLPSTTSAVPPTSSSSTSAIPNTTSSLPSTTSHSSTTLFRAIPSTTAPLVAPTYAPQADATHSAVPSTTSGLGTMTLVGIIFGSLIGVAIACVVIAFVIRHMHKKHRGVDAFDSAKFRRSAVMLDEKDQEPDFRPRPPTMIERRQGTPAPASGGANSFPPPPTMAYPYSDHVQSAAAPPAPPAMYSAANPQYGALPPLPPPPSQANAYGAIPGAYGVPAPGAFGAQYDQAGYGAPPIPGTYAPGAYAPYGASPDPRYPHHYQQQGYPQYSNSNSASYQQQPAVAYGPRMDSLSTSMSNSALVDKQALRAAEESSAAQNIGAGMMSTSSYSVSSSSSSSGGSSLTRQPTQVGGAPPAYIDEDGEGANLAAKSDVKVKPVMMSPPGLGGSKTGGTSLAPGSVASGNKATRPVSAYSSYSLYDQDDAYGGI